ncbi:MAG: thermonuclease family protein [Burkholderiaceae bacterium]
MKTTAPLLTHLFNLALAILLAATAPLQAIADGEISGFATMQDDGLLKISGYRIRLYGIYIPPTGQTCYSFIRPMPCGSRAALALNFKIEGDFVHCTQRLRHVDGSLTASCTLDNEDLSEWLLQKGWAVALPDAPFHYSALEKIAQSRGIGIWGVPVDILRKRR